MNSTILNKYLDIYLEKIKNYGEEDGLLEREKRKKFYSSFTATRLINMRLEEFYEYIGKLWAMRMWNDKIGKIDELISDNEGIEILKGKIAELVYGVESLDVRWDKFKENTKGFGAAMMSELLSYVYPDDCMIWNRTAEVAYKNLGVANIPYHNYQKTGKKYLEMTDIAKEIKEVIISKGYKDADLLFVDYFFWDQLRDIDVNLDTKHPEKVSVVNNKSYHNEIIDYLKNIGGLLGYDIVKGTIKDSGKVADTVWEKKVGNIGKIKYVFEVQDKGDIDSLLISLANASQEVAVQAVVAVSDEEQLAKIKRHSKNIKSTFNGKLTFWDINEIEDVYKNLSMSMETINKVINVDSEEE